MRRQRKRTVQPMELWNPGAVEQWLEDEASKGWRLTDCGGVLATFTAMEPGAYRVRLLPQREETPQARRERGEAFREMGWECAAVLTGGEESCEVFYCADPSAPELDTDPVARSWAWEGLLRRSRRRGWAVLGLLLALPVLLWALSGRSALELLLRLDWNHLPFFAFFCLLGAAMVRRLWHLHRMRRELAAGLVPNPGSWKRDRRWQQGIFTLLLLCWGLWLFTAVTPLWWEVEATSDLPYLPPTAVAAGTGQSYWDFDVGNYLCQSTVLAPARFSVRYRGKQGETFRSAADRLRFEWLAEALYRQRAETFRKSHPGAAETALSREHFDQGVLLDGGAERMLLVRSGKVVYALWTNFPAEDCLDTLNDLLGEQ